MSLYRKMIVYFDTPTQSPKIYRVQMDFDCELIRLVEDLGMERAEKIRERCVCAFAKRKGYEPQTTESFESFVAHIRATIEDMSRRGYAPKTRTGS